MTEQRYTVRPQQVEAMRFVYTHDCFDALKSWLGDAYLSASKARSPTAIGVAELTVVPGKSQVMVVHEGNWIVKHIGDWLEPVSDKDFNERYQAVSDTPSPASISNPVTVDMPLRPTKEMIEALKTDPTTSPCSMPEWHAKLGWFLCAYEVVMRAHLKSKGFTDV